MIERTGRFAKEKYLLKVLFQSVAILCISAMAVIRPATAADPLDKELTVDISPGTPLDVALVQLARQITDQTGMHVLLASNSVRHTTTSGLKGTMPAKVAIATLLEKSGLEYRQTDHVVSIVPVEVPGVADGNSFRTAEEGGSADEGSAQGEGRETRGSQSESTTERRELAEVIVTAQKREERLLDVPISIVALSGDELQSRKLTRLDDLEFEVPGMSVYSDGYSNRIELRGVSNDQHVAPLVGMYIDEVDVTNSGGLQINPNTYDLERVEVLRGPQGTLYGEGSAGGTVRFITKDPVLDMFGMNASVSSLFTQNGSPGERINTAINVPLRNNELGIRVVGTFGREGGWIDQPAAGLKDINGQDLTNVRIKSLWRPSSQFSATFMAELYRDERSSGVNDDVSGNVTQPFNLTTTPKVREAHDIYNLTLTYDFPIAKILNTTSYVHEEVEARDIGYNVTFPGPPPSTYSYLSPYQLSNDHAWIEELRLSSIDSGPWQWTVGGFYRHYRAFFDQPVGYYALLGPPGTPLPASYGAQATDALFKSWSFFGDINYRLWQRFTLGFGVRSFHENQEYLTAADFGFGLSQTDQTGSFHSVDPRVYAQYQLSRDINLYTSAAKGFRSGGFNLDLAHPTFAPESVWTYELGSKMSLLEGHFHAEAAIFYTSYKDYVVSGLANPSDVESNLLNAGDAWIKGVEWDFAWRPSDRWTMGINGNYYDTRFTKINATSTAYAVGDPLDSVPKYQISSSAERDFTWDGKQVSMRLDYTRRGRQAFRVRTVGLYGESDVINLMGYSMNLHWSRSLSFNLFAQNLLNDRGLVIPVSVSTTRSRPRTYGVGFDVSL